MGESPLFKINLENKMDYLIFYVAAIFFFQVLCLIRVKDEYTIKTFIIGTYIWPFSILLVLFVVA